MYVTTTRYALSLRTLQVSVLLLALLMRLYKFVALHDDMNFCSDPEPCYVVYSKALSSSYFPPLIPFPVHHFIPFFQKL